MSRWLWRFGLLAVMAVSMMLRFEAIRSRDLILDRFDLSATLSRIIADAGMTLLPNPAPAGRLMSKTVYFVRPGCAGTSYAMPFTFNADASTMLSRLGLDGYDIRFIYLDVEWRSQDRTRMFLAWIEQSIKSALGQSSYLPVKVALALAEPRGCAGLPTPQWRMAWHRSSLDAPASPTRHVMARP